MADDEDDQDEEPGENPESDGHWDDGVDPTLRMWVYLANNVQAAAETGLFDVTLLVSGEVVSGRLIAFETWQSRSLDLLQASGLFPKAIENLRRQAQDASIMEALAEVVDSRHYDPRFVHLGDVTIGKPPTTVKAPFWRGRLDTVDGWTIGGMTVL